MASVDLSSITDGCYANRDEDAWDTPAATVLFGRTRETQLLLDAYQNVLQNKKANRVVIHGVSGSGKTSLVDLLRQPVYESQGYFVSGKYFQDSGIQEPYSAIMAAFSDLCDLVSQSDDFTEERRSEIQQKLGTDGHLLAKAITNLSPFIDKSDGEEIDIRNEAVLAKFKVACKVFLHTMASDKHPLVFFIDDIQWMDEGSSQLMTILLNDPDLKNVMMILAYRDEESIGEIDILMEESKLDMLDIPLQNLQAEAVHQIIYEIIGSSSAETKELSDLIAQRTGGNPFHVIQFVEVIQREGLLIYDAGTTSWEFNVDQIQSEFLVSETLADLLALRMRRLPTGVQEALKIASLVGFRFREDIILEIKSAARDKMIVEETAVSLPLTGACPQESVSASLFIALDGRFIEKTKEGYQFSHDKLQASFQSMFDETEEAELHLVIGETFFSKGGAESMYHAAAHLHRAPEFVRDRSKRIELARINLEAAKYCKEKSAFVEAATLLHRGLELLDPVEKWTQHYDLAFEMTETLAKMELIIGNHHSCNDLTRDALFRAKTTEMKINSLLIDVECRMACNEIDGSIAAANRALMVLGFKMPRKVASRHVVLKLLKVKWMIGRKSDEDILSLPPMNDLTMATAVKLLLHLCSYCLLKDESLQTVYAALLATELTVKGGLSPYSASALTIYGVVELSNGDYPRAYRFGKLALTLLDRIKNKDAECPTTALALTLLTHWYDPVRKMPDVLFQAANTGFEIGDVVYGTYCVANGHVMEVLLGVNLEQLEVVMRATYQKIRDLSQEAMVMFAQPSLQYVLNMRSQEAGGWEELKNLTGEVMEEGAYVYEAIAANHVMLATMVLFYKAQLACWFGFWSLSESVCKEMMSTGKSYGYTFAVMPSSLFGGIASYSLYKENGLRKHLKFARKNRKTLRAADSRGCPNASAFLMLLDAEDQSVQKRMVPDEVSAAFRQAIDKMAAEGFPHFEGLANERAAFFQVKLGNRADAENYFARAMELYKYEWGSIAKYDWLKEKSAKALVKLDEHETGVVGEIVGFGAEDSVSK